MVKVTFVEKDNRITMKIEGHAGQAEKGHDIVCSACSILAYTVAQLVKTAHATKDLKAPPVIDLKNGDALISCEPWEHAYPTILSIYMYAEVGYKLLAHTYPQYVDLIPFGQPTEA